jgi:predicted Zn-ribbon and HTH transcriptional regulator
LRIPEREIEAHLVHIEKSVRGRRGQQDGRRFRLEPAACSDCGFVFRDRTRLTTPSRCPTCRSEQIIPPRYLITLPSQESRRDE